MHTVTAKNILNKYYEVDLNLSILLIDHRMAIV